MHPVYADHQNRFDFGGPSAAVVMNTGIMHSMTDKAIRFDSSFPFFLSSVI